MRTLTERIEQMTKQMPSHEQGESRRDFLARVAKVYDVPMNLIQYETIDTDDTGMWSLRDSLHTNEE